MTRRLSRNEVVRAARAVDPKAIAAVDRDGEPYQISDPYEARTPTGAPAPTELGLAVQRLAAIASEIEEAGTGGVDFAVSRERAVQLAKDLRRALRAVRG